MSKISKIERAVPTIQRKLRVAAYARVSMQSERMMHSISAQVSYYSELIQKEPDWEYAGVYADDFISATSTVKRDEFQRMLADCEAGKIDIILTKSISRFARNTVDLLKTVRHLKDLGIEVRFEKEHIHSMSGDGELMLSILASFAQEESRSISENVKWGTRKRFEKGIPNGHFIIYGYRWEGDHLVIEPEEAKIVRLIFENFLKGISAEQTEKQLEEMGVRSYKGVHFGNSAIRQILANITYTGNLLLQKQYISDPITGKTKVNHGELPQYWVENTHEAIIPMEMYQAVQEERKRRRKLGVFANPAINTNCFTSRIKCGNCGVSYRRSGKRQRKDKNKVYYTWVCQTYDRKGKAFCPSKTIPEETLKRICAEALGLSEFDENIFSERVEQITVIGDDVLRFHFADGKKQDVKWKTTAKTDWWTAERRKAWSQQNQDKGTASRRQSFQPFTHFIKCGHCGANYRTHVDKLADGSKTRNWSCCKGCGNTGIKDAKLREMVCDVLALDAFSEEKMDAAIEKVTVLDRIVTFHFKDGHTEERRYEAHRIGRKHSEAEKAHMSEVMKARWISGDLSRKRGNRNGEQKGHDHTGDHQ